MGLGKKCRPFASSPSQALRLSEQPSSHPWLPSALPLAAPIGFGRLPCQKQLYLYALHLASPLLPLLPFDTTIFTPGTPLKPCSMYSEALKAANLDLDTDFSERGCAFLHAIKEQSIFTNGQSTGNTDPKPRNFYSACTLQVYHHSPL